MPRFWVTYKIDARYECMVEAEDIASAFEAAQSEYIDADFGVLSDIIEGKPIIIEDENNNYVWEKE